MPPTEHGKPLDDRDHWRTRAKEMRGLTEQTHDPELQRQLLQIAVGYDRLVEMAEGCLNQETP